MKPLLNKVSWIRRFVYKAGFRPKLGEMKPISIFGPDQMVSRHPDIPDQDRWMALNQGPIERFEPKTLNDLNISQSDIDRQMSVYSAILGDDGLVPIKRHYLVTPRKHGRTQAMVDEIKYRLKHGKGSVAYLGPGMTVKERPNPWPICTDAWHVWNIDPETPMGRQTYIKASESDDGVGWVYEFGHLLYDAQKAANGVRTVLKDSWNYPPELFMIETWLPPELI